MHRCRNAKKSASNHCFWHHFLRPASIFWLYLAVRQVESWQNGPFCLGMGRTRPCFDDQVCVESSRPSQQVLHVSGCYYCCKVVQSAPALIRTMLACLWSVEQDFLFGVYIFQTYSEDTVWWVPLCRRCCCCNWNDLTPSQQPRAARCMMIHVQRKFVCGLNQAVVWKDSDNRNCSWAGP